MAIYQLSFPYHLYLISIGNSGTPQDADPAADATAEAHEAEVAEVVDPASEVSDQSWIMEEPVVKGCFVEQNVAKYFTI